MVNKSLRHQPKDHSSNSTAVGRIDPCLCDHHYTRWAWWPCPLPSKCAPSAVARSVSIRWRAVPPTRACCCEPR
eukprot:1390539-Pleurochrysis_carterae.AAC.1